MLYLSRHDGRDGSSSPRWGLRALGNHGLILHFLFDHVQFVNVAASVASTAILWWYKYGGSSWPVGHLLYRTLINAPPKSRYLGGQFSCWTQLNGSIEMWRLLHTLRGRTCFCQSAPAGYVTLRNPSPARARRAVEDDGWNQHLAHTRFFRQSIWCRPLSLSPAYPITSFMNRLTTSGLKAVPRGNRTMSV